MIGPAEVLHVTMYRLEDSARTLHITLDKLELILI
jgi:hypothetical protein